MKLKVLLTQIQDTLIDQSSNDTFMEIIEPLGALLATSFVIIITFYLSNLKHDMLDHSLHENNYKLRKVSPYMRLRKIILQSIRTPRIYL